MGLTSIPTYATGDTIEASWANMLRDNALVLDARTGGDPSALNKWIRSTGALAASWVDRATEVLAAIGYTPVSKAGDSMSGDLKFAAGKGIQLDTTGSPGRLFDVVGFTALVARANILQIYNAAVSTVMVSISPTVVAVLGQIQAASAAISGLLSAGSISSSTTIAAGTDLTASGQLGVNGPAAMNDTLSVAGKLTGSADVQGVRLVASVADGATAPFVISSAQAGVASPNLRAATAVVADAATNATNATNAGTAGTANALAAGVLTDAMVAAANKDGAATTPSLRTLGTGAAQAAAGNHTHVANAQIAAGSYSGGGGGSKTISGLGFTPFLVVVQVTGGGVSREAIFVAGATASVIPTVGAISAGNAASSGAGTFTVSGFDVTGETYRWVAAGA
jgi:hypothetical protein